MFLADKETMSLRQVMKRSRELARKEQEKASGTVVESDDDEEEPDLARKVRPVMLAPRPPRVPLTCSVSRSANRSSSGAQTPTTHALHEAQSQGHEGQEVATGKAWSLPVRAHSVPQPDSACNTHHPHRAARKVMSVATNPTMAATTMTAATVVVAASWTCPSLMVRRLLSLKPSVRVVVRVASGHVVVNVTLLAWHRQGGVDQGRRGSRIPGWLGRGGCLFAH